MIRPPSPLSRRLRATFLAAAFLVNLAVGALIDTLAAPADAPLHIAARAAVVAAP